MPSIKKAYLAVVWVGIALGVGGLSSAYVPPTVFMPLALLGMVLPLVSVALLISLFFSAAMRLWVPLLVGAVVVYASFDRHLSPDRLLTSRPTAADLVLMTYNAPKYPDDEWAVEQVTSLVERTDPDVIALQESVVWTMKNDPQNLRSDKKFRPAINSMGYTVKMPPAGGPPEARYTHWRPPVLLKSEPLSQTQVDLSVDEMGFPEHSVLRTEFEWRGRRLALYNVHLVSHGVSKPWGVTGSPFSLTSWRTYLAEMRRGFQVRRDQVEQIRSMLDSEDFPTILVGDFNNTADSWTYRQLSSGFTDAYRIAGSGWGATYPAPRPVVRIDFVLIGPEFEAVSAFVADPYPTSSDHRPLLARLRWREETK